MLKKTLTLVAAALTLAAVAVPGSALADWSHEGSPLESEAEIEMSGPAGFEVSGLAGAHFTVHLRGRLFPFTRTGQFNTVTVTGCTGTGQLSGLTCTGTVSGIPWGFHKQFLSPNIQITNVSFTFDYYAPNDTAHANRLAQTTTVGNLVATVNNESAFSSVSLAGEGMTTNGNPSTFSGTLAVTPAGTYGDE